MKSAYELAMERLQRESPSGAPLTDEQKAALADLDKKYESKIAEKRILANQEMKAAASHEELEQMKERLQVDIRRLESERDEQKEKIRKGH